VELIVRVQMIRDQFTITTWLCLGALIQGSLFLAAGRLALAPAALVITYKVLLTYAKCVGFVHNDYMDGVITKKFAGALPNESGDFGSKPAADGVAVLLIGARSNSPLGMLGSGYKQLGDLFDGMVRDLDKRSEEYGFLGATSWLNFSDRSTSSELMTVCYFRSVEGIHQFAHDPLHMYVA
jgi:hypothetical protein